jgi:hypothetical protein
MLKGRHDSGPKSREPIETARAAFLPKTKTFEAFTQTRNGKRASAEPSARKRVQQKYAIPPNDRLMMAVLAAIALGLVAVFGFAASAPKTPWAFDRPAAQLPSLQARHTLY